jgi:hypothetical protein
VQGASSTSQTKLEQLKFYQIFMLEEDLKWGSSGNFGPALSSRLTRPSFAEWPYSRSFSCIGAVLLTLTSFSYSH